MKKWISGILCGIMLLVMAFGFVGCKESTKTGPIPNGSYTMSSQENVYCFTETDIRDFFGWEIQGDTVQRWTSGSVDYKAKIVKREGKIFFEGYKWVDLLSSCTIKKSGFEDTYEVVYNGNEKTITLIAVQGEGLFVGNLVVK